LKHSVSKKVTNLAIIFIEKEIPDKPKYNDIIDILADLKCRKVNL